MAQQNAAAIAQENIEEIDKELEEVCVESPINLPLLIPMNRAIYPGEINEPPNAEEEDKGEPIAS